MYIYIYISESGNNVAFCFSCKTSLKHKLELTLDVNFFFFLFPQNVKSKKYFQIFACVALLFFGLFLSQNWSLIHEPQLWKQVKKVNFCF